MKQKRQDHEPPLAVADRGWHYHHIGIPTCGHLKDEVYLPQFKLAVGGFDSSPFGIEWMRYDEDSPGHDLIKRIPHIAFEVDDLDKELKRLDFKIITFPNAPSPGVRVAMIEHNGSPIELIEFSIKKYD